MQAAADKIVERIQNAGPFESLSDPAVIEALIDGLKRQIERLPARSARDADDPGSSDRILRCKKWPLSSVFCTVRDGIRTRGRLDHNRKVGVG